ncbi:hypothetical protein OG2516_15574 [Oceanicola granulosus HTCC2516]|uniref:DUF3422 domain-containing protein n=1 Tax=Oceanicola granulosus (strain ATCC BAA-861 / DSM 15982 / KCTC 12143 / HTCC2516) TaxID=314256 RepID=Q2CF98_OCEGH|nr:DUF3422 domain-containing protein [Oceanicola granulosus]EAR51397.1 hypothetical protein OG2516_15574 [Oceanicola granulosus HTCC2516]
MIDHPQRYAMANELHARPFPVLEAPARAAYLALKPAEGTARDLAAERAHLIDLLDRFDAPHPQPGATHWFGRIGRHWLKWESHTEFVTFLVFGPGLDGRPFDPAEFGVFPAAWLEAAPGVRVTSALIRVAQETDDEAIAATCGAWFEAESLALSRVLDDELVVAADFRIDPAGHMRLAVFARPGTGPARIGRVVQRLCEIETYKALSMLGLFQARALGPALDGLEARLTRLVAGLGGSTASAEETLKALLAISGELEDMAARSSFRFGATGAYAQIVGQRIDVLHEQRFLGRQTFGEFMMRRYDPAMRTVRATERRLATMAERALRAGDLLRTRVDVERSAENQALLASMDRRADLQLRLQHTVEGLSVVAISYYAVNLVLYLAAPFAGVLGKGALAALVTPPVILAVWLGVRRIRRRVAH